MFQDYRLKYPRFSLDDDDNEDDSSAGALTSNESLTMRIFFGIVTAEDYLFKTIPNRSMERVPEIHVHLFKTLPN